MFNRGKLIRDDIEGCLKVEDVLKMGDFQLTGWLNDISGVNGVV